MIRFLKNIAAFVFLFLIVILVGICLPPTPRASTSHLFAKADKDSLLRFTPSPRLILIGGSNLSMSINSQLLKDSIGLNPVNTGLSASIGLQYMLDHTLQFVRKGDVVIVCPEYSQFYNDLEIGTEDLLRVILENEPLDLFKLRPRQLFNSLRYIPRYALSKFKISEYMPLSSRDTSHVYLRTAFNRYGDMDKHWLREKIDFEPLEEITVPVVDNKVLFHIHEFNAQVQQRGATMFFTFPAIDHKSYHNQRPLINQLEKMVAAFDLPLLGDPSRFRMPSYVMFDTPYHLTSKGVETRTQLLIEDMRKASAIKSVARYTENTGKK